MAARRKCKHGNRIKGRCPTKAQKKAKEKKRREKLKRVRSYTPEQERAIMAEMERIYSAPPAVRVEDVPAEMYVGNGYVRVRQEVGGPLKTYAVPGARSAR